MKILQYKTTNVEAFGTGYITNTEYTVELINGTEFKGSVAGEVSDESVFIRNAQKKIAGSLVDSCAGMKEIISLLGDFEITVGGEDMEEQTRKVSELGFWDIQDYNITTSVVNVIVDDFTDEVESLYCEVKPLRDNPQYEDYFVEPDYFYEKGISLLEYAGSVDEGNPITPISIRRVDLGRDDLKSAQEITGGENFEERLGVATDRVANSIFGEELMLDGDRVLIIRRREQ